MTEKIMEKRKQNKYKVKYTILFLLIIVYATYSLLGKNSEEKMKSDLLNSNNTNIKKLVEMSEEYPKVNGILKDIKLYPESLIDLASKNPEAIDFVANYPKYSEKLSSENISIKKDYKKGEIPLFIQWDKRWGYDKYGEEFIAVNGCGPTSLAMIAVGLTGNTDINPKGVVDYSRDNGYLVNGVGTSWKLMTEGAKYFGLTGKEIPLSKDSIISNLKNGHPIIASMGPGEFTSKGHFIVLKGVDEDGKIIVNDPNSKLRSEKTWDIDVFIKETKNLWAFNASI
ncbi:C39 family peptidase [Paraclostridium ghonii]|uniref:C39 family peptidase n=1 Tax=Paraclostridium ghonii TaxID=29358 RepID=UPI00202CE8D6|nr:C39 family peptidase [Paeniclostridium ghonii]MCM0164903.1 C39 family peptidase [Paeniclostridium ghonii]